MEIRTLPSAEVNFWSRNRNKGSSLKHLYVHAFQNCECDSCLKCILMWGENNTVKSFWDRRACRDLDYTGWDVWNNFMCFLVVVVFLLLLFFTF